MNAYKWLCDDFEYSVWDNDLILTLYTMGWHDNMLTLLRSINVDITNVHKGDEGPHRTVYLSIQQFLSVIILWGL